jgi:hypothetical protein
MTLGAIAGTTLVLPNENVNHWKDLPMARKNKDKNKPETKPPKDAKKSNGGRH